MPEAFFIWHGNLNNGKTKCAIQKKAGCHSHKTSPRSERRTLCMWVFVCVCVSVCVCECVYVGSCVLCMSSCACGLTCTCHENFFWHGNLDNGKTKYALKKSRVAPHFKTSPHSKTSPHPERRSVCACVLCIMCGCMRACAWYNVHVSRIFFSHGNLNNGKTKCIKKKRGSGSGCQIQIQNSPHRKHRVRMDVCACVPQQNHLHITQNTCIFSGDRSVVLLYSQTHRASLKVHSVEMSMFLVELQHWLCGKMYCGEWGRTQYRDRWNTIVGLDSVIRELPYDENT